MEAEVNDALEVVREGVSITVANDVGAGGVRVLRDRLDLFFGRRFWRRWALRHCCSCFLMRKAPAEGANGVTVTSLVTSGAKGARPAKSEEIGGRVDEAGVF